MAVAPPDYHSRLIDPVLDELTDELPALLIAGPRAVGKTTTLERRAATTIRLNVAAQAAAFEADPDAALRDLAEPVLLDEWQTVPGVLGAVARSVNDDPRPGRFFITGSASPEMEATPLPGTGRLVRVSMYPMTVAERQRTLGEFTFFDKLLDGALTVPTEPLDLRDYVQLAVGGGFPRPVLGLRGATSRTNWFDSYIHDLLTHDVEQVEPPRTRPRDPSLIRRYFEAYALNSAGVADHKTIFDAAGIRKETAADYEALLTRLFVVDQVPAWTTNRLKRVTGQPKRYVVDPALLVHLLRLDVPGVMRDGNLLGRVIDTFVAAQLRPEIAISPRRPRLYHVRTKEGRQEIDLVLEFGGDRVIGIEIKAGAAPGGGDARHLFWLRDELGDRFLAGVVLHTGPAIYELGPKVIAAPISTLWTE